MLADTYRQGDDAAAGRRCRPCNAAGGVLHLQLQAVIAVLLEHIHIPGHRLAVQGAIILQDQLVCLLLRSGLQAGNILEVAALDAAAVLGQLTVGAAVNGAVFQHYFGVSAAQNTGIRVADPKLTLDHAVQQIYFISGICDGHIPVVLAGQNVLCLCVFNAGDGQRETGFAAAPADAGLLFGQTVRADLDRNDGICCFLVRTGSCRLCCRSRRPSICKCRYREDGEHHTERQYHAHDAFFHDILSFVDRFARLFPQTEQPERTKGQVEYNTKVYGNKVFSPAASAKIWYKNMGKITIRGGVYCKCVIKTPSVKACGFASSL